MPRKTRLPRHIAIAVGILIAVFSLPTRAAEPNSVGATPASITSTKRYLMAHYMPWFQTKAYSGVWGWHWTMNHYDPDHLVNGRRDTASHYYPTIGPYDSGDPDALQCQVLLMKMAGIDGVIFDWYGNDEFADYGINNSNTLKLIPYLQAAGLQFAVCYETHTIITETAGKVFPISDAVDHGQRLMQWLQQNLFTDPEYLKIDGRPIFLTFGDPYYTDAQWNHIFSVLPAKPLYFTESERQEPTAAVGAFDWPQPTGGAESAIAEVGRFYDRMPSWSAAIPTAFPRFDDIYSEAGVGKSWGHVDDHSGGTYADLLKRALKSNSKIVQIVTWNDWGEGTQIEPSQEFGYRDLEVTQRLSDKYLHNAMHYHAKDLSLPVEWYVLRKKYANDPNRSEELAEVPALILAGQMEHAQSVMQYVQR